MNKIKAIFDFIQVCAIAFILGSGSGFLLGLVGFRQMEMENRLWFILSSTTIGGMISVLIFLWLYYKRWNRVFDERSMGQILIPFGIAMAISAILASFDTGWIGIVSFPVLVLILSKGRKDVSSDLVKETTISSERIVR